MTSFTLSRGHPHSRPDRATLPLMGSSAVHGPGIVGSRGSLSGMEPCRSVEGAISPSKRPRQNVGPGFAPFDGWRRQPLAGASDARPTPHSMSNSYLQELSDRRRIGRAKEHDLMCPRCTHSRFVHADRPPHGCLFGDCQCRGWVEKARP